jgi:hypothetical protein
VVWHSREDITGLFVGGPLYTYWFMFKTIPKTFYADGVPRFTKEDEKEMAEEMGPLTADDKMPFRELYEKRVKSNMTALHEFTWKQWHYGRMVTIGDAAHKVSSSLSHRTSSPPDRPPSSTPTQATAATMPSKTPPP